MLSSQTENRIVAWGISQTMYTKTGSVSKPASRKICCEVKSGCKSATVGLLFFQNGKRSAANNMDDSKMPEKVNRLLAARMEPRLSRGLRCCK